MAKALVLALAVVVGISALAATGNLRSVATVGHAPERKEGVEDALPAPERSEAPSQSNTSNPRKLRGGQERRKLARGNPKRPASGRKVHPRSPATFPRGLPEHSGPVSPFLQGHREQGLFTNRSSDVDPE